MAKVSYKWEYNSDDMTVTVTEKNSGMSAIFNAENLNEEMRKRALLYGIGKLLQDRNSQVDADEKMTAFDETWVMFLAGEFERKRKSGPRTIPAVVEAIARDKGCTIPEAQAAYNALDKDARKTVTKALSDWIETIKAERASADVVDLSAYMS